MHAVNKPSSNFLPAQQWSLYNINGGLKGGGAMAAGRLPPIGLNFFLSESPFPIYKAYSALCAFVTHDDEADTLSSAPTFRNFWIRHW